MNRARNLLFCLGPFFWAITLTSFLPSATPASLYYKFIDKSGTIHYTDRYEAVPPEYRDRVKVMKETEAPPISTSAVTERGAQEQARPKVETDPSKAQEKETRPQEADEKKFQAELEKEKRVEELRKGIESKVEEEKGLRTNWMVFDRIRLNQLNQEIKGLEDEIKSLRGEKTGE